MLVPLGDRLGERGVGRVRGADHDRGDVLPPDQFVRVGDDVDALGVGADGPGQGKELESRVQRELVHGHGPEQ